MLHNSGVIVLIIQITHPIRRFFFLIGKVGGLKKVVVVTLFNEGNT